MYPLELCQEVSRALLIALGVVFGAGCSSLLLTWRLYRTTRYLKEALARELRSSIGKQRQLVISSSKLSSSITRNLLETFLREPVPSLSDLVERTEREFRLRASARRSEEDEQTEELRTSDFIRR